MKFSGEVSLEQMYAEIDALPKATRGAKRHFTADMDAILSHAVGTGTAWAPLARWWKATYGWGCIATLRRRLDDIKGDA